MIAYEKVLLKDKPDLTIVVGDVNSTVAASMVAVKSGQYTNIDNLTDKLYF